MTGSTTRSKVRSVKPVQDPHIPFWIAGGGEQITLNIAARHASYTNFGVDLDQFKHKSKILQGHCEDLGSDFDSIVRSSNFNVVCAEAESGVEDKKKWVYEHFKKYVSDEKAQRSAKEYDLMSGTPDQIVERMKQWEEAGMTYAIVYFPDAAYDTSSLDLFAREVIPAFD